MAPRDELLAALDEKPEGGKILTWQEIASHPRLEQYDAETINDAAQDLESEGRVRPWHETGSDSPYYFDSIALSPD